MKRKKFLALFASVALCVSMLAGCGGDTPSEESTEPSGESTGAEESSGSGEADAAHSTDPFEMIHEGYYS